jgi:F420-0:gamma-glutamyl ligase
MSLPGADGSPMFLSWANVAALITDSRGKPWPAGFYGITIV